MRRVVFFVLAAVLVSAMQAPAPAEEKQREKPRFYKPVIREDVSDIDGFDMRANTIAAVDTYCIVWFDFEQMSWQGWTCVDNTAQLDTFFHVDDFAGLGGGTRGMLVPLEGTRSMWCGVRPGTDPYLCSWETAPGYGNYWDQSLTSDVMGHTGMVTLSYKYSIDTELGDDYLSVIFAPGYEETEVARHYGSESGIATHELFSASASFYLKFRFVSDAAHSDQDGLRDYDGAFIVDSITVSDESGLLDFEDFESAGIGETEAGIWRAFPEGGYGINSGLANNLVDRDPCNDDFATQLIFFNHIWWVEPPGPGLFPTPFCTGSGGINAPCQDEMAISPVIGLDWYSAACDENQDTGIPPGELDDLGGYKLIYQVYLDNPVENLVFHTWKGRSIVDGCPQQWQSEPLVMYYSENGLYYWLEHDISGMVESDAFQVALGVVDMCYLWYGIYGDCEEHTSAPWFDNVRIQRYATVGPQWAYQGADLFQDNFPSTDEMESFVRADMAADISPPSYPGIVPGDSVVVSCWSTNAGGLDTLGTGEARVYLHCNVTFLNWWDGKPDLFGSQLEGNYGTYASDDGDWTVLLCEPARNSIGSIAPDRYCIDLNDSLFTRGYMIEYYFKAYDLDGISTTLPAGAETIPPYAYPSARSSNLFEFTCLPLLNSYGTLYVDDFDGRGTFHGLAQTYYDPSFDAYVATDDMIPDRYDVNQPSAMVGNGLGSRARLSHLLAVYPYMIWDSGDLARGTIISSENTGDKSNDVGLLVSWLDTLEFGYWPGLIIMGDNVATDLNQYSDGRVLMEDWFGTELVHSSFYEMTGGLTGGGIVNPLVSGIEGMTFEGMEFYLSGGCPVIDDFDVLRTVGHGIRALDYPEDGDSSACAAVLATRTNSMGLDIYTEWMGFSFMRIRNSHESYPIRNAFLNKAFRSWLVGPGAGTDITEAEAPAVTVLAGIFPNPFNPVTRVSFSLKQKEHISMRVYDVSGRLVRVLVDEVREAGSYEVVWDGANDRGRATASGIYFCRMEADEYQKTVKMVLLR